jgi:hypothetical protein
MDEMRKSGDVSIDRRALSKNSMAMAVRWLKIIVIEMSTLAQEGMS